MCMFAFQKLETYQLSKEFVKEIYTLINTFPDMRHSIVGELILFGVDTTYSKCSDIHAWASFPSLDSGISGLGFGAGKFTATIACFGQTFSHLRHRRHFSKSM